MFDVTDHQDIAPEDMRELMTEMQEYERKLDLEELTMWLEANYPTEMGLEASCA